MSTTDKFSESTRFSDGSIDDPIDSALERAWKDASDQLPPMALDSAILTRARQEVAAPARRRGFLPRAWFAPLATASVALLVVGVSTGVLQQNDAPDPMQQLNEAELAIVSSDAKSSDTSSNNVVSSELVLAPRAAASQAAMADESAMASSSDSLKKERAEVSGQSETKLAQLISAQSDASAELAGAAPTMMLANELNADTPPPKVYQKPGLKRRAQAAPQRRMALDTEGAIENPLIARVNSARALDGRFVNSKLTALFDTDEEWFDMLRQLVSRGHVEIATELAGKFTLLRAQSSTQSPTQSQMTTQRQMPEDLAGLFARATEHARAKAPQSVN